MIPHVLLNQSAEEKSWSQSSTMQVLTQSSVMSSVSSCSRTWQLPCCCQKSLR